MMNTPEETKIVAAKRLLKKRESEQPCSETFMLIENLYNAAVHHKANCNTPDCNVSLWRMRMAAVELEKKPAYDHEQPEIDSMLDRWPF